jgi:hypothetical protein
MAEVATATRPAGRLLNREVSWLHRTLVAGGIILLEARRRLGVPLEVARGGVREGAVLALLEELAAAAA